MTTVERFTSIIDVFDDAANDLSLNEVASRAALPRSTTHRILDHLVRSDWLSHTERGYGLGGRALNWGAGNAADLRLREAAAPVLHDVHALSGAVVHLGVLDGDEVVHIDKLGGPLVPTRVGLRLPAIQSALGRAVLAELVPEERERVTDVDVSGLRSGGVVRGCGEYGAGWTSVAAAIDRRAAVGVVAPSTVAADQFHGLLARAATRIRRERLVARSRSVSS